MLPVILSFLVFATNELIFIHLLTSKVSLHLAGETFQSSLTCDVEIKNEILTELFLG